MLSTTHTLTLLGGILVFGCMIALLFSSPTDARGVQKISEGENSEALNMPKVIDPALRTELIAKGLEQPTSIAFLGPNDILILEKEKGTVRRILNDTLLSKPLLDVNVATSTERGMLGIAVLKNDSAEYRYVYLYYTEAESSDREDVTENKLPVGNRLYRYELINNTLVNPLLLLDLPADSGPRRNDGSRSGAHNGGAIAIGPDNNVYLTVGDLSRSTNAQNTLGDPDGSGGILRFSREGDPVIDPSTGDYILGDDYPLNLYYAYGIRNSFGIDFDPVTGNLWDTENGPGYGDEINLVQPGFNSGWLKVQGMAAEDFNTEDLVNINTRSNYSNPEFTWANTVAPTAIKFFSSDNLGKRYENDMFVSSFNYGEIYHFDLSNNRTSLLLDDSLIDRVSDNTTENQDLVFAAGFEQISDLEVNPYDGYLYIVSYGPGKIYRIVPGQMYEPREKNETHSEVVLDYRDPSYFQPIPGNNIELSETGVTLNGNKGEMQLISKPLNGNFSSIETDIQVLTKVRGDNHAGIIWEIENVSYSVFLRDKSISAHNTIDGVIAKEPISREFGKWYKLNVEFIENNIDVYLNERFQFRLSTNQTLGQVHNIGVRAVGNTANFEPLIIGLTSRSP